MNISQKSIGSNNTQIAIQNNIKGSHIISGTCIINGTVVVNGVELPPPPTKCRNTTIINNKVDMSLRTESGRRLCVHGGICGFEEARRC